MKKILTLLNKYRNIIAGVILSLSILPTTVYSFALAYKRYINFEYGKFDLGNMSQIVWNTSQGRFMEVTDQFGTNMPRWGMSHVDPILALFAPIYWFFPHPMVLVGLQHIVIISAIIPLFLFVRIKTDNDLVGYIVSATYLLYPAIGFTLVWTGFHGISFVAPLLIWVVWLLERNNFFIEKKSYKNSSLIIYWILVVLMLMGKEEIGAILAIASVFLFFKNKKLAIITFLVSITWFIIAFFVIIPAYSHLRSDSIQNFIEQTGVRDVDTALASSDNFFLHRYAYLGDSYPEMIKSIVLKPKLALDVLFTKDKVEALNHLFGPFLYIGVLFPIWLIALPDFAIVLLSNDAIFDISNHRIAFVISALFISFIYVLGWLSNRMKGKQYKNWVLIIISLLVLGSTLRFSAKTNNPIYISGKSLIETKIINKVFAQIEDDVVENDSEVIGYVRDSKVPRNDDECLNEMVSIINITDPKIYSGPDYLGAQASNREVNALFPARYWDADLVIADMFETKTVGPIGSVGWPFNKEGLRRLIDTGRYRHLYSCGKMSAFVANGANLDSSIQVEDFSGIEEQALIELKKMRLYVKPEFVPESLKKGINSTNDPIKVLLSTPLGDMHDKTTFITFEKEGDEDIKFSTVNYISIGSRAGLDKAKANEIVEEKYSPVLPTALPIGTYKVFYGVGDLLEAKEMYIGKTEVVQ